MTVLPQNIAIDFTNEQIVPRRARFSSAAWLTNWAC